MLIVSMIMSSTSILVGSITGIASSVRIWKNLKEIQNLKKAQQTNEVQEEIPLTDVMEQKNQLENAADLQYTDNGLIEETECILPKNDALQLTLEEESLISVTMDEETTDIE